MVDCSAAGVRNTMVCRLINCTGHCAFRSENSRAVEVMDFVGLGICCARLPVVRGLSPRIIRSRIRRYNILDMGDRRTDRIRVSMVLRATIGSLDLALGRCQLPYWRCEGREIASQERDLYYS